MPGIITCPRVPARTLVGESLREVSLSEDLHPSGSSFPEELLVAGRQSSVKRMLAYSSIAHAGYILIGVVATMRSSHGESSVLYYLPAPRR